MRTRRGGCRRGIGSRFRGRSAASRSRTAIRCTSMPPRLARRRRPSIVSPRRWSRRSAWRMPDPLALEQLWYGKDPASAFARTLLTPGSLVYGGAVGMRDAMYEVGWLRTHHAPISVVSVGNLTVGGTGKTPIAAWIARGLAARGARPAIVLRGYGDDEPLVHRSLNRS